MAAGFFVVSVISAATFGLLLACVALDVDVTLQDVVALFIAASIALCVLGECQLEKKFRSAWGLASHPIKFERASLPFVVFPLLIFLTQWLPVYFLNGVGDEAISVFNIAVRFASLITFFSISIDSYLAPKFSALHAQGSYARIQKLVAMFRGYSLLACAVFFVLYFLCGEPLMTWWVGDAYAHAYYVAVPVLVMYFFMLVGGPYQSFLLMSDQDALVNRVNVLSLILVSSACALALYLDVLNELTAACALLFGRGVAAAVMMRKGAQYIKQQLGAAP
jgi:O-antigen/teichoic acid export membrane protein